ncbi:TPM domain-containing protein [Sinimarinibacterium sp. CAU 1509]|uniref:TPM domain-containing protein n=1 Tax=Sinimarinibacterium sp. CAU 1509 TaxID=2562283 RepID=UPI0010ABED52|nr:TPM domain-containing protein [Sinimarinibacterium sp. CAU 1509]TJY63303.1 TPM domain-containing protein [Sinimarinibacterium sp. CAU 1509]
MRALRYWALTVVVMLAVPVAALAYEIPEFTPNVVDPSGFLTPSEQEAVNAELQRIRESSHIWGAVFIVGTLDGEPIENVAVQAFEKWQLGQKDVDNGLLLVLAIDDRKSRFEVGYGLEGSITDVAALHALDDYLAPKMRGGDTEGAIVDAFGFLSRIVEQDPDAVRELEQADAGDPFYWRLGLIAWGVLLIAIWFGFPIRNRWVAHQRARLQAIDPSLSIDDEEIVKTSGPKPRWKGSLFVQAFLSINPGVFVFLLAALSIVGFVVAIISIPALMVLVAYFSGRRYASPEIYRQFLEKLARRRAEMIRIGHLKEKSPGVFEYTPAYHASQRSSSSSGSSSSSSSSGGGRSGGGGASSSW